MSCTALTSNFQGGTKSHEELTVLLEGVACASKRYRFSTEKLLLKESDLVFKGKADNLLSAVHTIKGK